jgi:hypothetical protein
VTTVSGVIGAYIAWVTLPPKLRIDSVIDKSKKFNSESRLVLQNIGRLPAWNIRADLDKANLKVGGLTMSGSKMTLGPNNTYLNPKETTEIPILSRLLHIPPAHMSSCDFELHLKYDVRILFFKKELQRTWHVELRNYDDGTFTWNFTQT